MGVAALLMSTPAAAQAPPGGGGRVAPPPQRPPSQPVAPRGTPGGAVPASPAPVTIEPAVADFGLVGPGTKHPAKFRVRNDGQAPLSVQIVMPSCKCTATRDYTGTVIPVGGTMELDAVLDAPTTPGVKEAKINIIFTGYGRPSVASLRCDVRLPVRAVEEFVDALQAPQGVLTIEAPDGSPFRILSSNGAAPDFVDGSANGEALNRYKVNWSVDGWACDGMRLWWIIETDREDCPILPCRIRHQCTGSRADPGRVARKWIFKEALVNAGKVAPGKTVRLTVDVENSEPQAGPNRPATFSTAFRQISSVTSLSPDATAKLVSVEPRGTDEAVVTFDFTPRAGLDGMLYAMVRVTGPTGPADVAVVASVRP